MMDDDGWDWLRSEMRNAANHKLPHIDWSVIHRRETITRMAAAPYFEEAGSLFLSAASAWHGRKRAEELRVLGYALRDASFTWIRNGLGWTDPSVFFCCRKHAVHENASATGQYLSTAFAGRRYRAATEGEHVSEGATRLLLAGALALVKEGIAIVHKTGDMYRRDHASMWEDKLEVIQESPCAKDLPLLFEDSIALLHERAFYRIADQLANAGWRLHFDRDTNSKEAQWWSKFWCLYVRSAEPPYVAYCAAASSDAVVHDALMAIRDDGWPDSSSSCGTLLTDAQAALCDAQLMGYIIIFQRLLLQGKKWEDEPEHVEVLSLDMPRLVLPNAHAPLLIEASRE